MPSGFLFVVITHHPFLHGRGHQFAILRVKLAADKSARAGGRRAFHAVQQPFIQIKRTVELHGMIDRGNLNPFFQETNAVGLQGNGQEIEIGGVA